MALDVGATLGPFEITGRLGAGGMGEVYSARDTRLGREVALKILPSEFAGDSDRLARFTREARLASQLNHPNIVMLHDVGESGGVNYLAMELVEGRTLRAWMGAGGRPTLSRRVAIAAQIAEGLAHAHRAGIVHRDLKPDNVMITSDGRAKILDFGIARRLFAEEAGPTKTLSDYQTSNNELLGTVPYMSPEQARGATVDYRSDQFALGTMLYEMVTGTHPFAKGSSFHTLSAIVEHDVPPITTTDPTLPAPLAWTVARCLAKEPGERYESTADLARDLATISSHLSGSGQVAPVARPAWKVSRAAAVVLVIAAVAAGWAARSRTMAPAAGDADGPAFRQLTFRRGLLQGARFTADGSTIIAGGAWDGGPFEIDVVRPDRPETQKLDLPPTGIYAVSSTGQLALARDCNWVAAGQYCRATLATAPLGAGAPRNLVEGAVSADWSPDGKSLAVARRMANGAQLEYPVGSVIHQNARGITHVRFSPDGKRLAFTESGDSGGIDNNQLSVIEINGQGFNVLASGLRFPSGLAWSHDGSEVWLTASRGMQGDRDPDGSVGRFNPVFAVGLDGKVRDVLRPIQDVRLLDIARDGRVLLARMESAVDLFVRVGAETRPLSWFDFSSADGLSLDGRMLVFTERGKANQLPTYSLYVRDLDGAAPVFLGEGRGHAISPDKKWVLAQREPKPGASEFVAYPTGTGSPRVIGSNLNPNRSDFLPDSNEIIFAADDSQGRKRTFLTSVSGGPVSQVVHVTGGMASPLAPDGHRFISQQDDGSYEVSSLSGPLPSAVKVSLKPFESVRQWTEDGSGIYISNVESIQARQIERLDLATGRRTPVAVLKPANAAGLSRDFSQVFMTRDAKVMVYSEHRNVADLILASGMK